MKSLDSIINCQKVIISERYLDFAYVFLNKLAAKLLNCFDINKHVIYLKLCKQLLYKPIYSFKQIKLKTFKTYIEVNLANEFI